MILLEVYFDVFLLFHNHLKSYALGEIPSLSDRITIVRQLWDLTRDVLVWFQNYDFVLFKLLAIHCLFLMFILPFTWIAQQFSFYLAILYSLLAESCNNIKLASAYYPLWNPCVEIMIKLCDLVVGDMRKFSKKENSQRWEK